MIKGLAAIVGLLLLGELVAHFAGIPVPGSVLGMILLAAILSAGWIRDETVRPAAEGLTRHLGLFFVPAGASVVLYADVIRGAWLAILVASVVSTLLVFAVVGRVAQALER